MIRAVLFDMDGVLAFTEKFYAQRRLSYLAENGIQFENPPDWTGANDTLIWEQSVPDPVLREKLRDGYGTYVESHPTPWNKLANPQARRALSLLKGLGVSIAICSSSWRNLVLELVDQLDLDGIVDYVLCGAECAAYKPAPDIYLAAMKHFGLNPDEVLIVEDSPIGIEAGRSAGAFVCALRQPAGTAIDQSGADLVIDQLMDVVDLTRSTNAHG